MEIRCTVGRASRCLAGRGGVDLLDAAFLGGTAAHGIELDDGYRHGSAHCGCVIVPTVLAVSHDKRAAGRALIEAIVVGYETNICLARACAPDLRQRGFHPTSAVGPFGAAMATGKLRGLSTQQLANALGIAASSAAGLFAFVAGGGDIKRLHAGHASREGMQAALLADRGTEGLPNVVEGRDGFMQVGFRVRTSQAGAANRAAARGRIRYHRSAAIKPRLLLLPYPAGGRGDVRPLQYRKGRVFDDIKKADDLAGNTCIARSTPMCRGTISPAPSSASRT